MPRNDNCESGAIDVLGNHRKIGAAGTGIDRLLQNLADQFGAADFHAGILSQFQRIGQVFQGILRRERAFGKLFGTIAFRP